MSDQENNQAPRLPPTSGYEDESVQPPQQVAAVTAQSKRADKFAELKANFNSVFGHGIGKAALWAAALVIIIAAAMAVRGFRNAGKVENTKASKMDVPTAPAPQVSVTPVDSRELANRAGRANMEAEEAANKGQSYQPPFNPVVNNANASGQGQMPPQAAGTANPPASTPPTPPAGSMQGAQANGQGSGQPVPVTVATGQTQQSASDEQKRQTELDKQRKTREEHISQIHKGVREQVEELLKGGDGNNAGLRGAGTYSSVSYLPSPKAAATTTTANAAGATSGAATKSEVQPSAAKKKVIFKAGKSGFATLDTEVDTDDTADVFATMFGGPYDGATLIGKIEQAPRNIRLRFTTLSPKETDRPSLTINAVAIREEDAKQGIADVIDNHTLERYTSLFAGSVLSGFGKAASQPQGSVIVLPNGQTVAQQADLTGKRIAMFALGEVGSNAAEEVKKNFAQPPTYKRIKRNIGIIFVSDVVEP